ncbi:hypothetical protein FisN_6Hh241 [Fistulifera solaris]|jgi:hypothetical protein|uniref:CCR4-NOT transcription complex subunit 10 n=1 Tax=Fistulifera solaris TaxID=1519565 RepID=A0A1Z5K1X3_FISSO|nr:hypothetical protein FisN_6Hh241 [Fistulifera solaris]|eukprot:GAX20290.1 hypothetical protein FisN_6Hh241 [Fistulifera solaris]
MNCVTAAELNNLGALHLQGGHLRTSLDLFRDALSLTLLDLEAEQRSSCCNDISDESRTASPQTSDEVAACSASPNQAASASSCTEEADCLQPSPSSTAFVQSQAINVIPLPNAYSHDPLVNMTIVSSIVLFNLGIVYHLKGLEGTNESSSYLVKSCSLYQKSQVLLADSGVPLNCTGNPVIDILSMAINNNLAQVFFELSMYDDSRQHFEQLIAFAVTVVPARYGDLAIGNLIDEQKSKFLLNAMILHAPKLAPAA